jgi:hypothetical protein
MINASTDGDAARAPLSTVPLGVMAVLAVLVLGAVLVAEAVLMPVARPVR